MSLHKSESGISALEVLIVISISVILFTAAVAQFGTSRQQLTRQNIAREFKVNLERCRFDSVRRRASEIDDMSRIVIRSQTSYDVMVDSNQDGAISSSEVRTINISGDSNTKILVATELLPVTIRFNQRGHITSNSLGGSVNPLFTICSGSNCQMAMLETPENSNVISISPTGTVSMLYGGDVIPPLNPPDISNVNSNTSINLWLTVGTTSTTATPTPTPTPTPQTTPTPTATPVATPTPTPNSLSECALNARPGNSATCTCSSPRYVRTNGKCQ